MRNFILAVLTLLVGLSIAGAGNSVSSSEPSMAQSDSLYAIGVKHFNKRQYKKAITYFKEVDRIDNQLLDSNSPRAQYGKIWVASCLYRMGDTLQALKIDPMSRYEPIDRRKTVVTDSLSEKAWEYFAQGNINAALQALEKGATLEREILGENNYCYANTLLSLGSVYYQVGNILRAIECLEKAAVLGKKFYGEDSENFISTLSTLSAAYQTHKDYAKSISTDSVIYEIARKTGREYKPYAYRIAQSYYYDGENDGPDAKLEKELKAFQYLTKSDIQMDACKEFAEILSNEIASLIVRKQRSNPKKEDLERLVAKCDEFLKDLEIFYGLRHPYYITTMFMQSLNFKGLNNVEKEGCMLDLCIKTFREAYGKDIPGAYIGTYKGALINNCLAQYKLKNYRESAECGETALKIGIDDEYMNGVNGADFFYCLAQSLNKSGHRNEGKEYLEKSLELNKNLYGRLAADGGKTYEKIYILSNEIKAAIELQRLDEAREYIGIQLPLVRELYGDNSIEYVGRLVGIAEEYQWFLNYKEAIPLYEQAKEICEVNNYFDRYQEKNYYGSICNLLPVCYENLGEYDKALDVVMGQIERFTKEGKDRTKLYYSVSNIYDLGGDAIKSRDYAEMGVNERMKTTGVRDKTYADCLLMLARFQIITGNYEEALKYLMEYNGLYSELEKNDPDRSDVGYEDKGLANIGYCYGMLGDYRKAIEYSQKNLERAMEYLDKHNYVIDDYRRSAFENVAVALNNIGAYHLKLKEFDKAKESFVKSIDFGKRYYGKDFSGNTYTLIHLTEVALGLDDYAGAREYLNQALANAHSFKDKVNPTYIDNIKSISTLQQHCGFGDAVANTLETSELLKDYVRRLLPNLTTREREKFWNMYAGWYTDDIHSFAAKQPNDTLVGVGFDGILMSKGLLLNSEIGFRTLIQESGDSASMALFDEFTYTRNQIDARRKKGMPVESFVDHAEYLEKELLAKSKEYGDYTQNLVIGWKEIRSKLRPREVAIEFASYTDGDSKRYVAYLLTDKMTIPAFVAVCNEDSIARISRRKIYTTEQVSDLVWKPLEKYIADADKIYFSPTGMLYDIAIETVPSSITLGKELRRLSSTRELALSRTENGVGNAMVFGGLKYDADMGSSADQPVAGHAGVSSRGISRYIADSLLVRGDRGVLSLPAYLPATKIEAQKIGNSLMNAGIKTEVVIDTLGTERRFKEMSGQRTRLLHIATHGFYTRSDKSKVKHGANDMMGDNSLDLTAEDKALTRSGLLLAGSNVALRGDSLPYGMDDGILTAKEIASLDLRGMDLVVLSACQTGLGQVTGEGVFGLQRGFKKAGARSLLMSLWKVDDNATQLLMTKFYDNMLSGHSEYDALELAKKSVREHEEQRPDGTITRPYSSPDYWAAFILLDPK